MDVSHSKKMYKALQRHNKQVEYIELKNGTHHMEIEKNRIAVLEAFDRFLNRHIAAQIE